MSIFEGSSGYWIQQCLNGLVLASFYATLATAYALLQGITNKIILSFGDFAMFGAFAAVYVALWALLGGQAIMLMLALAFLSAFAAGAAISRLAQGAVFQPLIRSPSQAVMISSIGVSIIIQEIMRLQSAARDQWLPPYYENSLSFESGGFAVRLGMLQMASVAVAATALLMVLAVMRSTAAGRLWRACSENARLAELSGVDTAAVFRWSFIAAGSLAGIAGWIAAAGYGAVSFYMGLVLGFKAMFASLVGGFGTVAGALAGGVLLASLETAWSAIFPLAYRDIAVFAIVILILVVKPEGLLGTPLRQEKGLEG
jgi:branched-chain amino acid transport system permease protein